MKYSVQKCIITLDNKAKIHGLFIQSRVKEPYSSKYHKYQFRHTDDDSEEIGSLEKVVWVNFYGDFFTKDAINILDKDDQPGQKNYIELENDDVHIYRKNIKIDSIDDLDKAYDEFYPEK